MILICFAITARAKPISVATTYTAATPLPTLAVPKVLASSVSASIIAPPVYHTPVYKHLVQPEPYDPNPEYHYSYGVNDPETGDSKHAEETLKNGIVHGSYSLAEPDGTIRKVSYTADDYNGFNAVVEKLGAPLRYVAPVVSKYVAPIAKYVAPAAPVYHAPIAKYVAPVYHAAPAAYHAPLYTTYHGYH